MVCLLFGLFRQLKPVSIIQNQSADDTSLILEGDSKSHEKRFRVLREFEHISGLKLNYDKNMQRLALK